MAIRFFVALTLLCASVFCGPTGVPPLDPVGILTEELGAICVANHDIDVKKIAYDFFACTQLAFEPFIKDTLVEPFIQVVCKDKAVRPCLASFKAAVAPCLDDDMKADFQHMTNGLAAAEKYACQNEGRLRDVFIHGKECFLSKALDLYKKCTRSTPFPALSFRNMFSKERCLEEFAMAKCVSDVLDDCEDNRVAWFYRNLVVRMHLATPCKSYISN